MCEMYKSNIVPQPRSLTGNKKGSKVICMAMRGSCD